MLKEYPLDGIKTYEITLLPDERGFFGEILRTDWSGIIEDKILQVNMSYSFPEIVRAWHKHVRGQVDHFLVLKGALKICAYDENSGKLVEIIGNSNKPRIIRIPGKYLHGFKNIGDEPALLVYFVNSLYDYNNPDEIRVDWNDPNVIPTEINGNKNDPRVNKAWDWFYPPHK